MIYNDVEKRALLCGYGDAKVYVYMYNAEHYWLKLDKQEVYNCTPIASISISFSLQM